MTQLNKICAKCGTKQKKDGECWDYNECTKCFSSTPMKEIVAAQQIVRVNVANSIYILGPTIGKMNTALDQALQKTPEKVHFTTPANLEKANQNMEWVVS